MKSKMVQTQWHSWQNWLIQWSEILGRTTIISDQKKPYFILRMTSTQGVKTLVTDNNPRYFTQQKLQLHQGKNTRSMLYKRRQHSFTEKANHHSLIFCSFNKNHTQIQTKCKFGVKLQKSIIADQGNLWVLAGSNSVLTQASIDRVSKISLHVYNFHIQSFYSTLARFNSKIILCFMYTYLNNPAQSNWPAETLVATGKQTD